MRKLSWLPLAAIVAILSLAVATPPATAQFTGKKASKSAKSATKKSTKKATKKATSKARKSAAKKSSKGASPCKGLSKTVCTANPACTYVKASVRKSTGKKISAYCRKKPSKKK